MVEAVVEILDKHAQPSAWELLAAVDRKLGLKARWAVVDALVRVLDHPGSTNSRREYVRDLVRQYSRQYPVPTYDLEFIVSSRTGVA